MPACSSATKLRIRRSVDGHWRTPTHRPRRPGEFRFMHYPQEPNDFASIIYIHRAGTQNNNPFGETYMPEVNQPAEEYQKLWETDPRRVTKRKPHRITPKPTALIKRKKRPLPSNRPPARRSN